MEFTDLDLYSTMMYTPGWCYKRWPGFYNIECYKILSHFSHHPEKYLESMGVEETKDNEIEDDEEEEQRPSKKIRHTEEVKDT